MPSASAGGVFLGEIMEYAKRIRRELAHKGNVIDLYTDTMETPDGDIVHYDFFHHNGAAAAVPVMADGRILMVRQYRNAVDRETLELPAGKLDYVGEPGLQAAARELEEETGYRSDKLTFLISVATTVALGNEVIDVFLAEDLKKAEQNLDFDEYIGVEAFTIEELNRMIFEGKIQDGKTIAGLMAYQVKKRGA